MARPSLRWSVWAGLAAFVSGALLMVVLGPVSRTLAALLKAPAGYSTLLFAGPAAVVGTLVWWATIERPAVYSFVRGGGFGMLTALFTIVVWLGVLSSVWDLELVVTMGGIIVALVAVVTVPVGIIVGVAVMYARRELADGLPTGEPAPTESG